MIRSVSDLCVARTAGKTSINTYGHALSAYRLQCPAEVARAGRTEGSLPAELPHTEYVRTFRMVTIPPQHVPTRIRDMRSAPTDGTTVEVRHGPDQETALAHWSCQGQAWIRDDDPFVQACTG